MSIKSRKPDAHTFLRPAKRKPPKGLESVAAQRARQRAEQPPKPPDAMAQMAKRLPPKMLGG